MKTIAYKGYTATAGYSKEGGLYFGKIEGIKDLVDFSCENESGIQAAFTQAVDDYLNFCSDMRTEPEKPNNGT